MSTKAKFHLVDMEGTVVSKVRVFITARPALVRWTIKVKDMKKDRATYLRRTGVDDYLELTPKETTHMLDWMSQTETDPEELTIDKVAEILKEVHIEKPQMIQEA
jgi:hypothetical protein